MHHRALSHVLHPVPAVERKNFISIFIPHNTWPSNLFIVDISSSLNHRCRRDWYPCSHHLYNWHNIEQLLPRQHGRHSCQRKIAYCAFYVLSLFLDTCQPHHYGDVIMGAIPSQITSLTIVYSTVYSGADQRKHQSFASLAFVRGIHPHKWPVTRKMFPFDYVIMIE